MSSVIFHTVVLGEVFFPSTFNESAAVHEHKEQDKQATKLKEIPKHIEVNDKDGQEKSTRTR